MLETTCIRVYNEYMTTTTVNLTVGDRELQATWRGTDDLVPGRSLVVNGPSTGMFWKDEDAVCVVREVEVLSDRTCTEVRLSNGQDCSGSWSGMKFLVVDDLAGF